MKKKSFILYSSWESSILKLSEAEQSLFLRRMFARHTDSSMPPIEPDMVRLEMFWETIGFTLESNDDKYQKQLDRMAKARKENPKVSSRVSNNRNDVSKDRNEVSNNRSQDFKPLASNANDNANANANDDVDEKEKDNRKVYKSNEYIPDKQLSFKERIEKANQLFQ